MNFVNEYKRWLESSKLSDSEKAILNNFSEK